MLLQKYLRTIENIDPGKIYIENVSSLYKIPRFAARVICEMAVQENIFVKRIGVVCPNCDRIIEEYSSFSEIPETIECFICEAEDKKYSFVTSNLQKIEFYKLEKYK